MRMAAAVNAASTMTKLVKVPFIEPPQNELDRVSCLGFLGPILCLLNGDAQLVLSGIEDEPTGFTFCVEAANLDNVGTCGQANGDQFGLTVQSAVGTAEGAAICIRQE